MNPPPVVECDPYVAQLRDVFDSCDCRGCGRLDRTELHTFCCKLQLEDDSESIIKHLLLGDSQSEVEFKELKDGIICYLSGSMKDSYPVTHSMDMTNCSNEMDDVTKKTGVLASKGLHSRKQGHNVTSGNTQPSREQDVTISEAFLSSGQWTGESENNSVSSDRTPGTIQETFEAEGELDIRLGNVPMMEQEDEPLREIWDYLNLDINQDLSITDLQRVCDHIGLNMSPDELEFLFRRLDSDGDGKIAFAEVHEGLFQHGLASGQEEVDTSLPHTPMSSHAPFAHTPRSVSPKRLSSLHHRLSLDDSVRSQTSSVTATPSGIFSALDKDKTGQCWASEVLDYWDTLGVTDGEEILQDLGFDPHSTSKLSLGELSFLLAQEMSSVAGQNVHFQAGLLSFQQEFNHYRGLLEQLTAERKKLRKDLLDANTRNELLVKEADERHFKIDQSTKNQVLSIEQKYQAELKSLQSLIDEEREANSRLSDSMQTKLEEKIENLKHGEELLKTELEAAQKEVEKLERDVGDLMDQLDESETQNDKLRRGLLSLTEGQSPDEVHSSGQALLQLKQENKELKDKSDELAMEVERLRQELKSARRRTVSEPGSPSSSPSNKRRRQVSIEYLRNEEAMDDEPLDIPQTGPESEARLLQLGTELEQMRNNFELERRDIEEAFKMEIVEIEERHDRDREQLLRSFAREKEKIKEELESVHQGELAELERTLQNEFAAEKQDMILKHESEKNYIRVQNSEREELAKGKQSDNKRGLSNSSGNDKLEHQQGTKLQDEVRRVKTTLLDSFLREKRDLEERHSQEKAALFQEVEAERKELVEKHESQKAELEAELRSVRERLEAARDALLGSQKREREAAVVLREQLTRELREQLTRELREQLITDLREQLTQEVKEETEETFVAQMLKMRSGFEEERRMMESRQKQAQEDVDQTRQADRELREQTEKLQQENKKLVTDLEKLGDELETEKTELVKARAQREIEKIERERTMAELEQDRIKLEQERSKQTGHRSTDLRNRQKIEQLTEERDRALGEQAKVLAQQTSDKIAYQKLLEEKDDTEDQLRSVRDELTRARDKLPHLDGQLKAARRQLEENLASSEKLKAEHEQSIHAVRGGSDASITVEQLTNLQLQLREAEGRATECENKLEEEQQRIKFSLLNVDMVHKHKMAKAEAEIQRLTRKLNSGMAMWEEQTEKLSEQCKNSIRTDLLLSDLTKENSRLMQALHLTEKRQKEAEEKYYKMAEQCMAWKSVSIRVANSVKVR